MKSTMISRWALLFLPFLLSFLTGCTGKEASVNQAAASLGAQPVLNQTLADTDFAFPSQRPSLMKGKEIFQQNCAQCHAASFWQQQSVKEDLAYTTPIDYYLMLTMGKVPAYEDLKTPQRKKVLPIHLDPKTHQMMPFKEKINRDDRWAVIFYTRYLAGAGDIKSPDPKTDVAGIFGGNCAVCHGSKGQGDGFLHTGKTGNHELHDAAQLRNLQPAPANFQQYSRVYNRTDAQLMKYLCEGIYPSAMPAWYGNVNLDKDTGKPTYVFDEKLLMNLVRYVRTWAYDNDLPQDSPEAKNPPPGLQALEKCHPMPTNRPWTQGMKNYGPEKGMNYTVRPADPITGGMTHVGPEPTTLLIPGASINMTSSSNTQKGTTP